MKLLVIGFPKSGTTTITRALEASGIKSVHWKTSRGNYAGHLIYAALMAGRPPFAYFEDYQAITQPDVCETAFGLNLWPQLDFGLLFAIRRAYPNCLFLLNYRDPDKIADSIYRWKDMGTRFTNADIPGLPRGFGSEPTHLVTWIQNHYSACRAIFSGDSNFLEIDIERADAPERLGRALGVEILEWGHYNKNSGETELA